MEKQLWLSEWVRENPQTACTQSQATMCHSAEMLAFPALVSCSVPFCSLGPERVGEGRGETCSVTFIYFIIDTL